MVNLALVYDYAGSPEKGIPLLFQALELIDPGREPRLVVCVRHNLIEGLIEAGRVLEAQKAYLDARPLYRQFPDPAVQNRRKWVKGKIARATGQLAEAESLFVAAREGFVAEEAGYDSALVSLDLASLYATQGRVAELKRLAEEILPIFAARQIHREALAALTFFQQAALAETVGLETVHAVSAFLKQARHDPGLRFQDSSGRSAGGPREDS